MIRFANHPAEWRNPLFPLEPKIRLKGGPHGFRRQHVGEGHDFSRADSTPLDAVIPTEAG